MDLPNMWYVRAAVNPAFFFFYGHAYDPCSRKTCHPARRSVWFLGLYHRVCCFVHATEYSCACHRKRLGAEYPTSRPLRRTLLSLIPILHTNPSDVRVQDLGSRIHRQNLSLCLCWTGKKIRLLHPTPSSLSFIDPFDLTCDLLW